LSHGMYVCRDIYVRAAAYSLNCHGGAMIYRMLYKTVWEMKVPEWGTGTK